MANTNPFAPIDFTKYMADFKVPGFDVEKLMAAQKKNFDTLVAANRLAAEGAQALMQRQIQIAREGVEEATAVWQELTAAGEPKDKVVRQAELTREGYVRTVANVKAMGDAVAKTNAEMFELFNTRFVESLDEVKGAVKTPAAPTGKKAAA